MQVDIKVISSIAFSQVYLKKKDSQAFVTSLCEIDRIIEEKCCEIKLDLLNRLGDRSYELVVLANQVTLGNSYYIMGVI